MAEDGVCSECRKPDQRWPIIITAAQNGHEPCVAALIQAGADVSITSEEGYTASQIAAVGGKDACLAALIKAGADVKNTPHTKSIAGSHMEDNTLIDTAAYGYDKCVELLIKAGANVNETDSRGNTALIKAAKRGNAKCIEVLCKAGADVNVLTHLKRYTALMRAAQHGHDKCVKMVIQAGADVNRARIKTSKSQTDELEKVGQETQISSRPCGTALTLATYLTRDKCVETLVKVGADVNAIDYRFVSPLMHAARLGKDDYVRMFIKAGADVNFTSCGWGTALSQAAVGGHHRCLSLLLKAGADVNKGERNASTALMSAARNGSEECVKLLLEAGANVNRAREKDGFTALMLASKSGSEGCVKLLVEAGADVNMKNKKGSTALVCGDCSCCLSLLLGAGPDVNVTDFNGETVLLRAMTADCCNISKVRMLLKAGVSINKVNRFGLNSLKKLILVVETNRTEGVIQFAKREGIQCDFIDRSVVARFEKRYKELAMLLLTAGEKIDGTTLEHCDDHGLSFKVDVPTFLFNQDPLILCLIEMCRQTIRKHLIMVDPHTHLFGRITQLGLPTSLMRFLLYDMSL